MNSWKGIMSTLKHVKNGTISMERLDDMKNLKMLIINSGIFFQAPSIANAKKISCPPK